MSPAAAVAPWHRPPLRISNTSDDSDPAPAKPTNRLPHAPVFVHRGPVARARRHRRVSLDLEPAPDSPLPTSPVSSGVDVSLAPAFADRDTALPPTALHYAVFTEIDTAVDLTEPSSAPPSPTTPSSSSSSSSSPPPPLAPVFPSFADPFPSACDLQSSPTSSSAATCVVRSAASLLADATEPVLRKSAYLLRGDEQCELDIDGAEEVSDEEDVEIRAHGPCHAAVPTKDGHGELIFSRGLDADDDRLLTRESLLVDRRVVEHSSPLSPRSPASSSDRRSIELGGAPPTPPPAAAGAGAKKTPRRRLRFPRLRARDAAPHTPHRFADLAEEEGDFFDAPPSPVDAIPEIDATAAAASRKSSLRGADGARRASISSRLRAHLSLDGRASRDGDEVAARPRRARFAWFRPRVAPDLAAPGSFVRNVSLAKDDFIEFATSAAHSQRRPWFMRRIAGPPAITAGPTFASPPPVVPPPPPPRVVERVQFPAIEAPNTPDGAGKSLEEGEAAAWGL